MKILIVDDNAQVRRIIRYAVRALATKIIECSDGDEVLALYAQHLPDIVLMDIHMPRVDGLTATRHLKAQAPEANVIIVTDIDDEGIRSLVTEAGAIGYVLKENLVQLDDNILEAMRLNH